MESGKRFLSRAVTSFVFSHGYDMMGEIYVRRREVGEVYLGLFGCVLWEGMGRDKESDRRQKLESPQLSVASR